MLCLCVLCAAWSGFLCANDLLPSPPSGLDPAVHFFLNAGTVNYQLHPSAVLLSLALRSFSHRSSVTDHVLYPASLSLSLFPHRCGSHPGPCVRLLGCYRTTILAPAGVDGNFFNKSFFRIGLASSASVAGVFGHNT